jgi:hypothetical protein
MRGAFRKYLPHVLALCVLASLVAPQMVDAFAGVGDFAPGGQAQPTGGIVGGTSANPSSISNGQSTTVSFYCRYANTAWMYDGSRFWSAPIANVGQAPYPQASFGVGPLNTTTSYETACQGNGFANTETITVTVGVANPCPTYADSYSIGGNGYLLYGGQTRRITSQGYNFCATNNTGTVFFIPANNATELGNFYNAAPGIGVSRY